MNYPPSIAALEADFEGAPDTALTALARRIVDGAKALDLKKTNPLAVNERFTHIRRDPANPPDFTHPDVLGAPWADDENSPLQKGEQWNTGRRATLTGVTYDFNARGRPRNPYLDTGMTGRGALGLFGPNHAVDNGVLAVRDDGQSLFIQGITRKTSGTPALAGGFMKYEKDESGLYVFNEAAAVTSRAEEFFEEMVSGSVPLLPAYAARADALVRQELDVRLKSGAAAPSPERQAEIREQVETQLKMRQVQDLDPGFLTRLRGVVGQGREVFAGPILAASRNTDEAWIETRLAWFALDEKTWEHMRGPSPVFDYKFSAGDDAGGLFFRKLDGDLLRDSYTHASPMAFMAASFLLDRQRRGEGVSPGILAQMDSLVDFMDRYERTDRPAHARTGMRP